jgi:hypothetical protein
MYVNKSVNETSHQIMLAAYAQGRAKALTKSNVVLKHVRSNREQMHLAFDVRPTKLTQAASVNKPKPKAKSEEPGNKIKQAAPN